MTINRIDMIKAAAEKIERRKKFKGPSAIGKLTAAGRERMEERAEQENRFNEKMDALNENHLHWTDSSKYAEKYYGETYRETTKFDDQWD